MNVSTFMCQIPSQVKKNCLLWYVGRDSQMYRLATVGMFNPQKLLAEVEKALQTESLKNTHDTELNVIKEYAENLIDRNEAEMALQRAAEKVFNSTTYSYDDAVEYFRQCWLEYERNAD